jgi:hypothetical protein
MTVATDVGRNQGSPEVHQGTPGTEHYMTLLEPLCSKFLLHEEERWEAQASTGLLATEQMDQEKPEHITTHPISH